jgi:predicted nicotinamide N-methyase
MQPPLVPEVRLHLAHEAVPIWQKTEDELGHIGLPPPFWAFAWAGGQALARYILDNREIVRGRTVIDIASGSGLVAIAALIAGASQVLAADIDTFAVDAIRMNATLNDPGCCAADGPGTARLRITNDNLLTAEPPQCDVILVGDLFYEKHVATACYDWLLTAHLNRVEILIGDPGRSYLPKDKLQHVAEYSVAVSRDLEDAEIKRTGVWRLKA